MRLWKMEVTSSRDSQSLTEVTRFEQRDTSIFVNTIKWHHAKPQLLMVDPSFLTLWSFSESTAEVLGTVELNNRQDAGKRDWVASGACWDPHGMAACAVCSGCDLKVIDTRSFDISHQISGILTLCRLSLVVFRIIAYSSLLKTIGGAI